MTTFTPFCYSVEPIVSNHPKCNDVMVAYKRWSSKKIEPQGIASEKRSRHAYFFKWPY